MAQGKMVLVAKGKSNLKWVPKKKRRNYKKSRKTMEVRASAETKATAGFKPILNKPVVWKMPGGEIPTKVLCKMKYNDAYINWVPAAATAYYTWRLNSINAPDVAGANQPTLHDAMAGLYNKYKVTACKVSIGIRNRAAVACVAGFLAADQAMSGSFTPDIIARSAHVYATLKASGQAGDNAVFTKYVPISAIVGAKYADMDYSGTFGSNPTDIVWGYLAGCTIDGSTNVSMEVSAMLTFYTECFEPDYNRAID